MLKRRVEPLLETSELVRRARSEYGEVITRIVEYPEGDIMVSLVGGDGVNYLPDGTKVSTWEPSGWSVFIGRLVGWWRRFLG